MRTEATGYGLIYILDEMLKKNGKELAGKTVIVSGSGNVAIYATQKAQQLGAKVVPSAIPTAMYMTRTASSWMLSRRSRKH